MFGGSLQTKLVDYSENSGDTNLTMNPSFSYFEGAKREYSDGRDPVTLQLKLPFSTPLAMKGKSHTEFAIESWEEQFAKIPDWLGASAPRRPPALPNQRVKHVINSFKGDLLHKTWLELTLPATGTTRSAGSVYDCINSISIEIGNKRIDKHSSNWLKVWNELSLTQEQQQIVNKVSSWSEETNATKKIVRIPLQFWFCRDISCCLPVVSLVNQNLSFTIEFSSNLPTGVLCSLWLDYITLYKPLNGIGEADFYKQDNYQIIDQVQEEEFNINSTDGFKQILPLKFTHPVKELIWETKNVDGVRVQGVKSANVKLEGKDISKHKPGLYFSVDQRYTYHTTCAQESGASEPNIYLHSFALSPEELKPTGSANFTVNTDQSLVLITGENSPTICHIYALNYNVLIVENGIMRVEYI